MRGKAKECSSHQEKGGTSDDLSSTSCEHLAIDQWTQ